MSHRRQLLLLATMVVVVATAFRGYTLLTQASEGVIKPVSVHTSKEVVKQATISNDYASFSYPDYLIRLSSDKPVEPTLAVYNLSSQQLGRWQVSVQVIRLKTANLADEGTYNYRQTQTDRYSKVTQVLGTNKTTVFTDMQSTVFSKVAYLQQDSMIATIALSGGTTTTIDQLQAEFEGIVASWNWR